MSASTATSANSSLKGMALGLAAYSIFAVHDALGKGVIHDIPVVQILFLRSIVVTLICLGIGRMGVVRGLIKSPNKPMLLLRGELSDLLSRDTVAQMRQRLAGLTALEVPCRGHAPTLDEPLAWQALCDWLERLDDPDQGERVRRIATASAP